MYLKSLAGALVAFAFVACTPASRTELLPVEGDAFVGPADAKVTVVEYGSPTCPACKSWHDTFWPEVKRDYIDTGKIKFVFREFAIHGAIDASIFAIARCSGAEDFFPVLDEAFLRHPSLAQAGAEGNAQAELTSLGEKFRLSPDQVKSCVNDKTIVRRINDVRADALAKNINATPTFVVNGTVLAANDWPSIKLAVDAALAGGAIPEQTPTADTHEHAPGETH